MGECFEHRRCSREQVKRGEDFSWSFLSPLTGAEREKQQQDVQTELSSCSPLSPEKPGKKKVTRRSNYRAWQGLRLKQPQSFMLAMYF